MNGSGESRSPIEYLAEEFLERRRRGEEPSVNEYMERYPELAEELQRVLRAIVVMEGLRPGDETPSGAIPPYIGHGRRTIPDRLGDFRILRFLAEGGMGYVFEAEQESMGRHVALKVLKPEMHSRTILARFLRESKAAGRLHHTNIIPIFGIGECDGLHFYAMQYIQGESLARIIADLRQVQAREGKEGGISDSGHERQRWSTLAAISRRIWEGSFSDTALLEADDEAEGQPAGSGPVEVLSAKVFDGEVNPLDHDSGDAAVSPSRSGLAIPAGHTFYKSVARIGEQAARALGNAHRHGVLHRDIKPANLLLDIRGTVWVADFGLAYEMDAEDISRGDVVGTIRFIPPERFRQESLPQGDVYSLGLTLYELVTLRPAFAARHPRQLMHAVEHEQPQPPRAVDGKIPRDLETIILKAIDKDPARRYATADAMADDLLAFREDREIRGRRTRWDERLVRWCRRSPVVAALTAMVLLLISAIAVGMTFAVLWLRTERQATLDQLGLTREAEGAGRRRLLDSLLAQAQARRRGVEAGRRYESLDTLSQAGRLMRELGLESQKELVLRNEAVACLALVDLVPVRGLPLLADLPARQVGELSDIYIPFDADFGRCVRLVDDGRLAVIRSSDGRVSRELAAPRGVVAGGFSPDGRFFAARAALPGDGSAFAVWDLNEDRPTPTIAYKRPVSSWAFHPDGHRLAIGRPGDGAIALLDLPSGRESGLIRSGPPPTEHDQAMAFSPDGVRLAVGSDEGSSVRVYDVERGTVVDDWPVGAPVFSVAWGDDGRLLAAGCDDHRIYVRDMAPDGGAGPVVVSALMGHKNTVIKLAFVGGLLVSNSHDETVRVWDPVTGGELTSCAGQYIHRGPGRTVLIEAPSLTLRHEVMALVGGEFRQVRQGIFGNRMPKPSRVTSAVSFHPGGDWLATSNPDGVRLYDTRTFTEAACLGGPESSFSSVAFHPAGGELMTFGGAGVHLQTVGEAPGAADELRIGPPRTVARARSEGPGKAPYSSDGRALAFAVPSEGWAGVIRDGDAGRMVRLGPHPRVRHVTLSPDGRFAATSTWKGSDVKVWDAARGVLVHEIPSASARCEFSPDGRWLATATHGTSRLWHVGSWTPGPLLHREDSDAHGPMAFSPDGTLVAVSVDFSRRIKLVRLDTAGEIATLEPPDQPTLHDLAFSADGALLAAATSDHAAEVWDLRGVRRELRRIGLDWELSAYPEPPSESAGPSRPRRVTVDGGH